MPVWLLAIVITNFLLQVVASAGRPLTSVRALGLGASDFELGLIAAAYASLALLVAVPVGKLIDRIGPQFFIVSGAAFMTLMMLATGFTYATYVLILIQSGIGLALINANLGMQSTIATNLPPQSRTAAFGHYSTGAGIGLLVGPAIGGVLAGLAGAEAIAGVPPSAETTNFPFFVLAGICCLSTLVAWWWGKGKASPAATGIPPTVKPAGRGLTRLILGLPEVKPVLIASAVFVTTLDLMAIYMPAYGIAHGYSIAYVGALLSIAAGGSIVARVLTGPITALLGRTWVMRLSLLVPAVGLILLPLLPPVAVAVDMAVIGLGLGFGQPTTMAWIASIAPPDRLAATLGVRISGNRVGQLLIPLAVAAVVAGTSVAGAFWALAAVLALCAAMFFFMRP